MGDSAVHVLMGERPCGTLPVAELRDKMSLTNSAPKQQEVKEKCALFQKSDPNLSTMNLFLFRFGAHAKHFG